MDSLIVARYTDKQRDHSFYFVSILICLNKRIVFNLLDLFY